MGTGLNRDVLIPCPLSKQSVEKKVIENTADGVTSSDVDTHVFQKAVKICCGSNFTVAIEQSTQKFFFFLCFNIILTNLLII